MHHSVAHWLTAFSSTLGVVFALQGAVDAGETIWNHNGSKITWASDGNSRTATYLEPRPGLTAAGVSVGTLLFRGERRDSTITGMAYTFKGGCDPVSYLVTATITSEREFVLEGAAPVFESGSCAIARYDSSHRNANLRFTFIPPTETASAPSESVSQSRPTGGATDQTDLVSKRISMKLEDEPAVSFSVLLPRSFTIDVSDPEFLAIESPEHFWGHFTSNSVSSVSGVSYYCDEKDKIDSSEGDGWCSVQTQNDTTGRRTVTTATQVSANRLISLRFIYTSDERDMVERFLKKTMISFIEGTETLRRSGIAARRQANLERLTPRPPPIDPTAIEFKIKSSHRYTAQVAFYSDTRPGHAWPGDGQAYNLNDSALHSFRLGCQRGEKICMGAWDTNNPNIYWGVGLRKRHGCTGCCYQCGTVPQGIELIYSGEGETASRGVSVGDLLDSAIAIGAGVAIGGGGYTAPRSAPKVQHNLPAPPRMRDSDVTRSR